MTLFCELTCSPRQSDFVNSTQFSAFNESKTNVDKVSYFISQTFANGEEPWLEEEITNLQMLQIRALHLDPGPMGPDFHIIIQMRAGPRACFMLLLIFIF